MIVNELIESKTMRIFSSWRFIKKKKLK